MFIIKNDYVYERTEKGSLVIECAKFPLVTFDVSLSGNTPLGISEEQEVTIVAKVFDLETSRYELDQAKNDEVRISIGESSHQLSFVNGVLSFDFSSEESGLFLVFLEETLIAKIEVV